MSTTGKSTSSRNMATRRRGDKVPHKSHKLHKSHSEKERQEVVEIEVINRQRLRNIDRPRAAALSRTALDRIGLPKAVLTVTFISDRAMRRLNRDYRGIDGPTDV